jgi:hypothetical protein
MAPTGCRYLRARRELDTARRDGASQNTINALERTLAARGRELDACLAAAGVLGVDFQQPLPIARSGDLFRTAPGDARDDGIRLLVRVLTSGDVDALNEQFGTTISACQVSRLPPRLDGSQLSGSGGEQSSGHSGHLWEAL